MPKSPKKAPAAVQTSAESTEGVLDDAMAVLRTGLRSIRKEIDAIASGRADDNGHDSGSRIAFLTAKVADIADSARKLETARQRRIDAITKPMVLAWFRGLDAADRAQMITEIDELNRKRSVLA